MLKCRNVMALLVAAMVCIAPARSFAGGPVAFSPVRQTAQNQTPPPAASGTASYVNPGRAMLHSLALPGWGQLDNGRGWKAAVLITAELVCIGGIIYEGHRLSENGLSTFERDAFRTDRNTFIIYLMLAKVAGMMDAYVDAHLANFDVSGLAPAELQRTGETP